ncbi:hypothetical protein NIES39_A05190 [Arthrospira platensis NIES-39]|nr:hypothetical protein NIES39_A05190 [Arthrospira platensis NIES-39]
MAKMSDRLLVKKLTPFPLQFLPTVIISLLALILWGCSPLGITPTPTLVQQGLTIQIQEIHRQLKLQSDFASSPQSFKITRVNISNMEPIMINNLPGFKVEGTYNLSVKFSDRWWREQHNRFQIYLQRQAQGKIWRLARLEKQTNRWSTMPIPHRRF